jgi:hypothetical protein
VTIKKKNVKSRAKESAREINKVAKKEKPKNMITTFQMTTTGERIVTLDTWSGGYYYIRGGRFRDVMKYDAPREREKSTTSDKSHNNGKGAKEDTIVEGERRTRVHLTTREQVTVGGCGGGVEETESPWTTPPSISNLKIRIIFTHHCSKTLEVIHETVFVVVAWSK